MYHEFISYRLCFMLEHGFKKIEQPANADYVIADGKYYYPISWIENDYIFYHKICRIVS